MHRIALIANCILAGGCWNPSSTTLDFSDFSEFHMEMEKAAPDCPCMDCPESVAIVRQADGTYEASYQGKFRILGAEESQQVMNLFRSLRANDTLIQCLTRIPPIPECRISFRWQFPDDSDPLYASSFPCLLGSEAVFSPSQTKEIMLFLGELTAD